MSDYPWDETTTIMGVLNTSPESFYDGSIHESISEAVSEAERMIDAGAEIIDIGGESNRPGTELVDPEVEKQRIVPFVEELSELDALISVDTWRADVAVAAIEAGADIINDVTGFADPEMKAVAANYRVPIIIGHSTDIVATRPDDEGASDIISDIKSGLNERIELATKAGVDAEQIIIDPRIGFGKTEREDIEVIARLGELQDLGYAILVGHSRKWRPTTFKADHLSGIDDLDDPEVMLPATIAITAVAFERGADIIRVHDVFENAEAMHVGKAMRLFDDRF